MERKHTFNIGYIIAALLTISLFQMWFTARTVADLSYTDVMRLVHEGKVESVTLTETLIEGKFKAPENGKSVFVASRVDPATADLFEKAGVKVSGGTDNNWVSTVISWVLPVLIFFGLWVFLFRGFAEKQGMGGLINIGKSRAKVYLERNTGVTFDDIAGADEAKAELQEVVSFLKDKEKYGRLGARVPKGILLVGPPGTGKTLMARAVAGEAQVPFFSISGSEFVEMFVGVGAARVRDLFEQARKAAPCIIFVDELDALGRARSPFAGYGGGYDEKEQTLNQLLAELDGFDPRVGIVLLAATNRPEILDPALTRAGRFDRQVVMDRPDRRGREAILKVHVKKVKVASDISLDEVAGLTPGFTGADLANLVNEAAIAATRRGAETVAMEDFTSAIERIVAGLERRSRLLKPEDRRRVAYHEMGHALAAATLSKTDPVQKVSIIPRSMGALGYTLQRPTDDRFIITASELRERMVALVAGRAAEDIVFGEISTGAADDLAKVTDIARQFVTRFGMNDVVGQVVLDEQKLQWLGEAPGQPHARDYSEATSREVDLAVRALIAQAYHDAKELLRARSKDLHAGAQLLLEHETITPAEFPPLQRRESPVKLPTPEAA